MKRILLFLITLFVSSICFASAPSSTYTYLSGTPILPNQVQTNENNIYSYLQSGVDTYKPGSITQSAISSTAGILYSQLSLSGSIQGTDINTSSNFTFNNLTLNGTLNLGVTHQGDILYDNGTSLVRLTPGISGQILQTQGAGANPQWSLNSQPYIKLSNTQVSGTGGGAATNSAWRAIPINTTNTDTGSNVVSLAGSTFVLVAGTYDIDAVEPFNLTNGSQTRLQNTTDSTTIITGESTLCANSADSTCQSHLKGRFTIAASKSLQYQYQVTSTRASDDGLGQESSFGTEVYGQIQLYRVN